MGNLLAYSGIATKIRAMESKLLKPEQFEEIANMTSVPEIVDYLRRNTAYAEALSPLEDDQIDRKSVVVGKSLKGGGLISVVAL